MADSDLIFRQAPLAQPADLIFGETEDLPDVELTLAATLPELTVAVIVAPVADVTLAATLPELTVVVRLMPPVEVTITALMPDLQVLCEARYLSGTERPTVAQAATGFQEAMRADQGLRTSWQVSAQLPSGTQAAWQEADALPSGVGTSWVTSQRRRTGVTTSHQEALPLRAAATTGYKNMLRGIRPALQGAWQQAEGRADPVRTSWQERLRRPRPSMLSAWQEAQALVRQLSARSGEARPMVRTWQARYQEAIVPPAGMYIPPVVPPQPERCYTPPPGSAAHLLYADLPGDGQLVFICEKHVTPPVDTVVVPIKRVYIVINNVSLLKVVGTSLTALPTYSLSLSIDVDSWTWGLSASLPGAVLADLQPVSGVPVELEVSFNGVPYRFLAEKLSRERTFGRAAIRLTGRGKSAVLDAPYAPTLTFTNTAERTAQQLMADALTFNGVPIGWEVDWQIDDWLVPAGVWHHQGAYISALSAIAGAAGAYLQPHPTDPVMRVLSRYPLAPWQWATELTPDFELPSAVTTVESMEWLDKPAYNRVYVSGVSDGILGQVTRTGSAGDQLAPMVTDALITEAAAARQRGRAILSDTGRQVLVSLKLPVLAETGLITPGKTVRYVDGTESRLGIVRSIGADSNGNSDVWQTIAVETHVEA